MLLFTIDQVSHYGILKPWDTRRYCYNYQKKSIPSKAWL